MIQTQVINLVIGVVTRSLAATDATSDRVGTCGAKLHERVQNEHQWQAGLQLPFRFALNRPERSQRGKRESFFRERVRQQAVDRLLLLMRARLQRAMSGWSVPVKAMLREPACRNRAGRATPASTT